MRQAADHRAPRDAFTAAESAPRIVFGQAAFQYCSIVVDLLTSDPQAEVIEQAKAIEVRGRESRLGHRRGLLDGLGVGTSIIGRPRLLSIHRHADSGARPSFYTLKREEPLILPEKRCP